MSSPAWETKVIHAGHTNYSNALTTPIFMTSTFSFDSAEQCRDRFMGTDPGYIYSRLGNPTVTALEQKLAIMEGAEDAVAVGSGIGALTTLVYAAVKGGDHIVISKSLYGCSWAFFTRGIAAFNVEVTPVCMDNLDELRQAIRPNTKLVFFETPANPTNCIIDIAEVTKIVRESDAKEAIVAVDNTFCSPVICNPIAHGADAVMHSGTKYLSGHGDVIAGAVCGSRAFIERCKLHALKDMNGAVMCPMTAFLLIRGIKTIHLRLPRHAENALALATFLEKHPKVKSVEYPFLPSHPRHEIAKKQMSMGNGIVPFILDGGREAGMLFLNSLKLATIAVSLGDAETLATHPASSTHSPYTENELEFAGIDPGLVRMSVGLEAAADIIADVEQALEHI
ncbi:Methionine gamma lyase [Carpediemonas membranifera]|uniref:Methionine gamma lyase n=1 Tax=Carpediemonas membranifera TaxID=201153 RepID=A0A8J6B603_9EUKA|nr:Methionine gamma lyase [Carpediemonas membranifera]|eukprot:KAG9396393.1 Methionine gamma lyase [Carpediemonas membranifera]